MDQIHDIVHRYIATWNETDAERRRGLIGDLYTGDGGYTDPNVDLAGPEQIDAFVAATQARFPGYVFALGSQIDGHHVQARFNWHALPPGDAEPAFIGFDVIATDQGRVRQVYGFIDRMPRA
jgi:SnoaL-like domain